MGLPYIDTKALIAAAGGDPWAINASLQAGSPLEISNLAAAFQRAGRCTQEANHAFEQARDRFDAAWNHQNGDHPINDTEEVKRVTDHLGAQSLQLPKIGADLENIAAALAEAQKAAASKIATLDAQLKQISDEVSHADDMLKHDNLSAAERDAVHAFINTCEDDALRDTKQALAELQSIRNGYADGLQKSMNNLHTEGYDGAPLHGVDSDGVPEPSAEQQRALATIRQITDQAVLDQMVKVRAAKDALDKAMADLYIHGPGSPEGEADSAKLPKLKADLAHALDDLGKIPDYHSIDPASVSTTPDGHFMFTYNINGQPVQVVGQLKNGAGEFFDQGSGISYTFNGGKLTGIRTLDPGKVEATPEPLWSAISLAAGGPALKAGGQLTWQGIKTLLSREMLEDVTPENVLARATSGAELREQLAASPPGEPGIGDPVPGTDPLPPPHVEHTPTAPGDGPVEHGPPAAGPHVPVLPDTPPPLPPDVPPPPALPPDHPLLDGYHPVELGPEFTNADGTFRYPDDTLAAKPYAVPGTIIPDAKLPEGAVISRFGYPGGGYLAPEGTPFAELALPPDSAVKPYFQYVVEDPTRLPPGWHIEQSEVASWFHQPGGGQQYRIIDEYGQTGNVSELVRWGYLRRIN